MEFREKYDFEEERNNSAWQNCTLVYLVTPHPACVQDSHTDEVIVGFIIIIIVIYTFYRLHHVWFTKLNFIEVNFILAVAPPEWWD